MTMNKMVKDGIEFTEFYQGYWVSRCGTVASQWSKGKNSTIENGKWYVKKPIPKPDHRPGYKGGYQEFCFYPFRKDIPDLIDRYLAPPHLDPTAGFQTTNNPDRIRITIKIHRLVMIIYKPFATHGMRTGITEEEWNNTPRAVQLLTHSQMVVNHIDHIRHNNHMDNLEWATSQQNGQAMIENRRKKGELVDPSTRKTYKELTREEKIKLGHLGRPHSSVRTLTPFLDKKRV